MDLIDGFFGARRRRGPHGSAGASPAAADGEAVLLAPDEPTEAWIGPAPHRRKAREWALVLQSMSIPCVVMHTPQGWMLRVEPVHERRALNAVELYENENQNWPPPRQRDVPRHPESMVLPLAFVALIAFFMGVTGPVAARSVWFAEGRSDAFLLLQEPWRMVTALTLHADAQHVIGNAISGSIFGSAVSRRLGPGGALLAIVASGAFGNAANALYHLSEGHRSIGASTAVFGAIGILATVQTVLHFRKPARERPGVIGLLAPVIGGLALLGALGASPQSDLGAHAFGFLCGGVIGTISGFAVLRKKSKASDWVQIILLALGIGVVLASWSAAMLIR
jgi:membrane associated rhomboid family serine protease